LAYSSSFAICEGLSAAMERLSHAAMSELRPRRVSQALQREAPSSHLPRPAARQPLVCVFLPLAGQALLMRAACVLGIAIISKIYDIRMSYNFCKTELCC